MWGVNWSAISFASWLLLWSALLGTALWAGVMLALNAFEMLSLRYGVKNSVSNMMSWNMKSAKARRLVNRWTPRLGMLVFGYILGQGQFFNPITEFHNVAVLSQDGPRRFTISIPGKSQPDSLLLCAWGDDLPLKQGMVMTILQYKQQRDCQLIDKDTQVEYLQDGQHNVVDARGKILFAKGE